MCVAQESQLKKKPFAHYRAIAQAFTAQDIAGPITVIPPETPLILGPSRYDAELDIYLRPCFEPEGYEHEWCWLVADEKGYYGYLTGSIIDASGGVFTALEAARPLGPRSIVPITISILDIVSRLAAEPSQILFVLSDSGIKHIIKGEELVDSMPFKFCLFALLMEFEAEMLYLLEIRPDRLEQRMTRLSQKRIETIKANTIQRSEKTRHNTEPTVSQHAMLRWTNLLDKSRMLFKDPLTRNLFDFETKGQADFFFELVRKVRNAIAHGESLKEAAEDFDDCEYLAAFIQNLKRMIVRFAEERHAVEEHGDSSLN